MASEVLNYLLLFSIGLGLVVSMEYTWNNLSDNLSDDAAEVRLKQVTQRVKQIIVESANIGIISSSDFSPIVEARVRLPDSIAGYEYIVSVIENPTGVFYVSSHLMEKTTIEYGEYITLPITLTITGGFNSYYEEHILRYMVAGSLPGITSDAIQLISK